MNRVILDVALSDFANGQINTYATNTIISFTDEYDRAIDSAVSFNETFVYEYSVAPVSIESTAFVDSPTINTIVYANSVESTVEFADLQQIKRTLPVESIESTVQFGTIQFVATISPESIASTATVSNIESLSFIVRLDSLPITTTFGWDEPLLNMQIADVQSVESTEVIPQHRVIPIVRPLSLASTANFGLPTFTDNIHRLLLFKDDNITKVGEGDAVVIAGGIRINSSQAKTNFADPGEAILPNNPVGFLSVNIDGNDYKIPYYN